MGRLETDTCRDYVLPRLRAAGWNEDQIQEQFRITDGQILTIGSKHRRGTPLRADYVLEYRPGVPIAVVEAKREYAIPGKGLQQAKNYAQRLDIPFSYSTNGTGIVEDDRHTGLEDDSLQGFPRPEDLWLRYLVWKGIADDAVADGLTLPLNRSLTNPDGTIKEPRYYQLTAINRSIQAIMGGEKRLLLTMATGTGKTFVAMQIVAKLWASDTSPDRNPRILYLADRKVLIDQPQQNYFTQAFGEGPIWRLRGSAKAGREIYFALYQALGDKGEDPNGIFREFAPDYFDLIIVDECHRGSARQTSSWRRILEHFSPATQLGMTATPKREETIDTYEYFGEPLLSYSLAEGIADGFLAPYSVRRVILSPDAHGWSPDAGEVDMFGKEIPEGLYTTKEFERVVALLTRTEAAARHLSDYLRNTDRFGKTIVFCVDQEHADQMRRALHNANSDLTTEYPDYVVRIVSDEGEIGRGHLARFGDTETETPVIATTSQLLSTGVDLPTVRNIALFRPVGSMALFKQMIGRGTRLFPDADKLSFDIIDYAGATSLFSDPEFDGPPERVDVEEVDGEGSLVDDTVVEGPPFEAGVGDENRGDVIDPSDFDHPLRGKYYVEDSEVWITAEAVYHLSPVTRKLHLIEYREYVAETVRRLFPDRNALRSRWSNRVGREDVRELLATNGIELDEIAERAGLADADPLDVLVFVAWNSPLASRTDRVRRVRAGEEAFFKAYRPPARQVLRLLLDKYSTHGVSELDDLEVLSTPPLSELGSPSEIAARFGSPRELRHAVDRLGELLYAA